MTAACDVAIVGAGISGLSCARRLVRAGVTVQLFDKGRRLGGRVAVRRPESGGEFDHGAQYFTARSIEFQTLVDQFLADKTVAVWPGRIVALRAGQITADSTGTTRYVGVPDMTSLADSLAAGLPILVETRVLSLHRDNGGWRLSLESGETVGPFRAVVVSAPADQSADLLAGTSSELAHRLREAGFAPCWAVLLEWAQALDLPFDGAFVEDSPLRWIARNNSKPGRAAGECWVLHGGPVWSLEFFDADANTVIHTLQRAFWQATGHSPNPPVLSIAHRWRYAIPETPLPERSLFDANLTLGFCGDWCGGPRVEGAFLSGWDLGGKLLELFRSL